MSSSLETKALDAIELDASLLDVYDWSADGAFLISTQDRSLLRYTDFALAPETIATFPGLITNIAAGPEGRIAVVTTVHEWTNEPHTINIVERDGSVRAVLDTPFKPWGIAWSPRGDALAHGGDYTRPGITVFDLAGRVLERASRRHVKPRVEAWTRDGILFSYYDREANTRTGVMCPAAERGIFSRRFRELGRPRFWPSPDGTVQVCIEPERVRVRGALKGKFAPSTSSLRDRLDLYAGAPRWLGSRHISLGSAALDLERMQLVHAVTPKQVGSLAGSPDGSRLVWKTLGRAPRWWCSPFVMRPGTLSARGLPFWVAACERLDARERERFLADVVRTSVHDVGLKEYYNEGDAAYARLLSALGQYASGVLGADERAWAKTHLRTLVEWFAPDLKYEWENGGRYHVVYAMTLLFDDGPVEAVLNAIGEALNVYGHRSPEPPWRDSPLFTTRQIDWLFSFPGTLEDG